MNIWNIFLRIRYTYALILLVLFTYCANSQENQEIKLKDKKMGEKVIKTEEEWKAVLSPAEFHVLREKGTERPFTGKHYDNKEKGTYHCAACGNLLFNSDTKYNSGCGWPSFYKAYDDGTVIERLDTSHGMIRTEILCASCESHLGHVFNDGPEPTGLRYCINSVALDFKKKE